MKKIHYTGYILSVFLGATLFISNCNKEIQAPKVEYIYDTIEKKHSYLAPIKEDSIVYIIDTLPKDTDAIVRDYLAKRFYSRLHEDTNILITIKDTISKNTIGNWSLSYKWKKPISIINNYPEIKKSVLFIGPEAGTMGVGIGAGYMNKHGLIVDGAFYPQSVGVRIGVRYGIRF